ncbi:MAG TPA: hypothetical protein VFQ53_22680 [Kofleriaceae bacterium]|nr:hypothetical protein [Kofleriaceae bacterium]
MAIVGTSTTADAGRSQYGWLYGTEVIPERGAEIQTWVAEKNGRTDDDLKETSLWWGALVGVTDQLELAFPVEFVWLRPDGVSPRPPATFSLEKFGVEARYRFVSQDPEDAPPFAPLLRVGVKRDISVRDAVRAEADLVMSYEAGRFHGLVDLGAIADIGKDETHVELRPGAGVSIKVTDELRVGGEVYSEISMDDEYESWAAVGPNLAWTHGRFWLSASYLVGVYQIDNAPRIVWGVLF